MSAAIHLAQRLVDQGIGTRAVDVFAGGLPDAPATAISVTEYGGLEPERAMAASAGAFLAERPRVQVLSRSSTYTHAEARAYSAFRVLDGTGSMTVSGVEYLAVAALQGPFFLARDEENRVVFAFNVQAHKRVG